MRIGYVPGVTPGKWVKRWNERNRADPLHLLQIEQAEQRASLDQDLVDLCFVRDLAEVDGLHVIRLYEELQVVVASTENPISVMEEIRSSEFADEHRFEPGADLTERQAVEAAASGSGVVVLPMSVARLHARKDVAAVVISDLEPIPVALAFPRDKDSDPVQEFIGVVRGRTLRSSR